HGRHRRAAQGPRGRLRRAGAGRHQRRDAACGPRPHDRPRQRARLRVRAVQCREAAVPGRQLRPGHDRLRPAQRDRQGRGAARDAARAQGRRAGARAGVLRGPRRLVQAALRLPLVQGAAAPGPAVRRRCRQLPLPGRVDPPASAAGAAQGDDGRGRLRADPLPQPVRRHRRDPRRLESLEAAPARPGQQAACGAWRPGPGLPFHHATCRPQPRRSAAAMRAPGIGTRIVACFRQRRPPAMRHPRVRALRALLLLLPLLLVLSACKREAAGPDPATAPAPKPAAMADSDEHSFAEPGRVVIDDLALDLALDFDAKTISGTATYTLEWKDAGATQLVLDTRELAIEQVEAQVDGAWQPLQFALADADAALGSRLTIETPQRPTQLRVTYRTSPGASGLQWLEPGMTE